MSEAFSWAHKIWSRLLVPSFPARSRRIQLPFRMISGLPFISAVVMEDMEGNVDDEKTFQAVFFVFSSL